MAGDYRAISPSQGAGHAILTTARPAVRPPHPRRRLSKLAVAVFLTRSGVTRLADRLEKEGLLRRDEHIQDRRGSCAVLTAQGWNELKRARAVFARTIAEHFGTHLSDREAETLNTILSRILMAEKSS